VSDQSFWLIALVVVLVGVASVLSGAEAALASFSPARAEELADEQRPGAKALAKVLTDPAPVVNTTILLRLIAEISAIVVATILVFDALDGRANTTTLQARWPSVLATVGIMVAVSYVAIGVAPRTIGRQRAETMALASSGVLLALTKVLGPIPKLLILIGNALTPGRGFAEGPFASEAELRELVDLAEASSLIETDERKMIHSVFELGDTLVREVMVPRTDVISIVRSKTLRQALSLLLRSGFSRLPVIEEDLDDIVGFVYLKDISKRVFDHQEAQSSEKVESVMRPVLHVPDTKPVDDLLREMQAARRHIAVVVDEYGGTAGLVTIEDVLEEIVGEITDEYDDEVQIETLPDGSMRVPSRYAVDDLEELIGVAIEDEEVDSVVGLMAKHLGKVPIPGSHVEVEGVQFTAEFAAGRRNRIESVLVKNLNPVQSPESDEDQS